MQQESTSPLVSHSKAKTKVGFVQLGDTAKACKEGRKRGHFKILFWTSSLQMECVREYFMERSTDKNWKHRRKILGSALHLSGNTAPLERKRSGRKGQSRKQNPVL